MADKSPKPGSYAALIRQIRSGRIAAGEQEAREWQQRERLAGVIEQSERSSGTAVAEESWIPRTWEEWIAATIWGVLVLGFGLEFCAYLVKGDYGHALVALFFLGVVSVMLMHGKQARSWALSISPNWVYVAALAALQIVIFLPFIEKKEWPFSSWFPIIVHDHATTDETVTIQEKLNKAITERDAARRELEKSKLFATQTSAGMQFAVGDEIANLSIYYQLSSATISGASAHIKEAIVQPVIQDFSQLGQLNYSIPIKITFDGEFGPFNVSLIEPISNLFGITGSSAHISITKNEKSELDILIGSKPSVIHVNGVFSISIRKQ